MFDYIVELGRACVNALPQISPEGSATGLPRRVSLRRKPGGQYTTLPASEVQVSDDGRHAPSYALWSAAPSLPTATTSSRFGPHATAAGLARTLPPSRSQVPAGVQPVVALSALW